MIGQTKENSCNMKLMGKYQQMRSTTRFRMPAVLACLLPLQISLPACAADQLLGDPFEVSSDAGGKLLAEPLSSFDNPWAMTFLPDGELLVTEKNGKLWLLDFAANTNTAKTEQLSSEQDSKTSGMKVATKVAVTGVPPTSEGGQGGLGDVILHPDFATNKLVYLSYVEHDGNVSGAVVATAVLQMQDASQPRLTDLNIIWTQSPKVSGQGHYGYRLAFSPDGYLFITSGERQKFDPAQDMDSNLGKVVRLHDDGSVPADNPFAALGGIAAQIWSLGHRNPLGIAFDQNNSLWVHEMGPKGGDELNLVKPGANYGYPLVSNGKHYNGGAIPDHDTRPELSAPATSWTPVISPSGLVVYTGALYNGWENTGIIGGLSSRSLVRVVLDNPSTEIERYNMGNRIREVEQGPDNYVYVLEDNEGGRLLRLIP